MRTQLFSLIVAIASSAAFGTTLSNDTALLVVHYGTARTPAPGIDDLNEELKAAYPTLPIYEAYTSPMVIKKLKKLGVEKFPPDVALDSIAAKGYGTILVMSSTVIDGGEMAIVREAAGRCKVKKMTKVANPLLYSVEDGKRLLGVLTALHPAQPHCHVAFIGHGTQHSANAMYSQLARLLADDGKDYYHVTTIEGYPGYAELVKELRASGAKKVKLVPLMFVAGTHVAEDINGEWKERLEAAGFEVKASMESLGQLPEVRAIYLDHLREAMQK